MLFLCVQKGKFGETLDQKWQEWQTSDFWHFPPSIFRMGEGRGDDNPYKIAIYTSK